MCEDGWVGVESGTKGKLKGGNKGFFFGELKLFAKIMSVERER